jgi:hypothetical protein
VTQDLEARLEAAARSLPAHTRHAMEKALRRDRVIAGGYSDRLGGVCPMLGAHRHGGRTECAEFARAWDAFTGAGRPREAGEIELLTLRRILASARLDDARAEREAERTRERESRRSLKPHRRTFRFRRPFERTLRRLTATR